MIRRNRRPTQPGAILRAHYLEPRGLTVSGFAGTLDVSRKHLSEVLNGRARISPLLAVKLARALDTTPAFWLNLQNAVDIWDAEKAFGETPSAA
ncbi:MAG TPA: HigA family addiction module antitoxin [Azospirillaceae bacterium]|nr:HigA family addiction module antitoxin [Azospirillaceae bacterium]